MVVLVGNKIDLKDKEEVTEEEVVEYANKKGMSLQFCSSLNGTGIEDLFRNIAIDYIQKKIHDN